MATVAIVLLGLAVAALLAVRIKRSFDLARDAHGPQNLYERVQRVLEVSGIQGMDDPACPRLLAEAEGELRVGLVEYRRDPSRYRLELREDELVGLVPWVVDPSGRATELSAFARTLNALA